MGVGHAQGQLAEAGREAGPEAVEAGCAGARIGAQLRDPAQTWEVQMDRAKRFHRQGLYPSAEHQYGLALETSRSFESGDPRTAKTLVQRGVAGLLRFRLQ